MITYSTNWMGPISMEWFRERGLTEQKTRVVTEDSILVEMGNKNVGDVVEYDEITTHYGAGRIDIRGVPDEPWGLEYGLAPMHGEDWNDFSDWLESFSTFDLWQFDDLIEQYEEDRGRKIRWAEDTWYKCYECGLVTDLRKTKEHIHKLDCTRSYDK